MKINSQRMRQNNKALIIEKIFRAGNISRAEICRESLINKVSVSEIVSELIKEEIIIEKGFGIKNVNGGKKPIMLEINKEKGIILTVMLDFDRYTFAAHTFDGNIIYFTEKLKPISKLNAVDVIKNEFKLFADSIQNSAKVLAICISVHGIVANNNIKFSPKYDLDQLNLYEKLREYFGFEIYIVNESDAAAIFEANYNYEKKCVVNLNLGSGIGAGIVMNNSKGELINYFAGEVGHTILQPNGKKCQCGNNGCIELYASNNILENQIKSVLGLEKLDYENLIELNKHNKEIHQLIEENAKILAILANNLIVSISPDIIIFNSPILRHVPSIINLIQMNVTYNLKGMTEIKLSDYGEYAISFGCFIVAIKSILKINKVYIKVST